MQNKIAQTEAKIVASRGYLILKNSVSLNILNAQCKINYILVISNKLTFPFNAAKALNYLLFVYYTIPNQRIVSSKSTV